MEKVDIAQQLLKGSHSTTAWKKETHWSIMENVVIAQQREQGRHSAAVLKK